MPLIIDDTNWQTQVAQIESLARQQGLKYHPVEFEVVPESFMTEIAIYGLPVRMPHWSFGVRYIYQLIQHRMGLSRLFEVVFPGNPGRAYLGNDGYPPLHSDRYDFTDAAISTGMRMFIELVRNYGK